MKKNKIMIALIAALGAFSVQGQQRLSLIELFSGASCSPCAIHVPILEDTISHYQDKVIILRHQMNIPAYDPMYNDYPAGSTTRYNYYGIEGVPDLKFDGAVTDFDITRSVIEARAAIPAPFNIDLTYSKTDTNISVNMIINAVSGVTGNLKARIAVIENEIEFPTPPGSNGERFFFKVLKQFIPSPAGTTLANTWAIGDADTISGSWTFANVYNKDEIAVIAYIQNDDTKEILQAAFVKPVAIHNFDAAITTISDVPAKICQGSTASILPRVTIVNKGIAPVTKLDIEYAVNDFPASTYTWHGNLSHSEFGIVHLPEISPSPLNLDNNLRVKIKNVNDSIGDGNPWNDTINQAYGASLETDQIFKVRFNTGNLGTNFGWRIVNDDSNIQGPYWDYNTNTTDTNVTITGLDASCWAFILKNINNVISVQNFNFRIYNMNDELVYQTQTIGHTLEIPFYNIHPVGIANNDIPTTEIRLSPNPASDQVTVAMHGAIPEAQIIVYNVLGKKVLEQQISNGSILSVTGLDEGIYFYSILKNNQILEQGKLQKIRNL
jgi:hypothetical protein